MGGGNRKYRDKSTDLWLLVEETGSTGIKTPTCGKSLTIFITYYCIEYALP
jgi:hypothetical protein